MLLEMNDRIKKTRKKVAGYLVIMIAFAIITESVILGLISERTYRKTTELMLNQVVDILEENSKSEELMIDSLKEEYIVRARSVAYYLDANPEAEQSVTELLKLARLMNIDELHLFNPEGVIYGGTEPKYYGMSMEDGDQIAFFKPMLQDKSINMCQDVTPNTAENKEMMYAMVWDSSGTNMVQIGIRPRRLLDELQNNDIPAVVDRMPAYEGMNIMVADRKNGQIYGATDKNAEGKNLLDMGIKVDPDQYDKVENAKYIANGYKHFCRFGRVKDYLVVVSYSTRAGLSTFLICLGIEMVYLLLAGVLILWIVDKYVRANAAKNDQLSILVAMSDIYYSMHLLELVKDQSVEYRARNEIKEIGDKYQGIHIADMMNEIVLTTVDDAHKEEALEFTNIRTLADRMQHKKIISRELVGKRLGWFIMSFITIAQDCNGRPTRVMCVTRSIEDSKKKEKMLIARSNTDGLTGLFNRRAYETDVAAYKHFDIEDDLVYISMDVNGLKVVNDSLGHVAGDELLMGASACMKQCLGSYGRLYRTGGDEFVALVFATGKKLEHIKKDFKETVDSWQGEKLEHISISCGYVTRAEFMEETLQEIAQIADKRMYEAKEAYYKEKGIDRNSGAKAEKAKEAQNALGELYAVVLQINPDKDSFRLIHLGKGEDKEQFAAGKSFTEWLENGVKNSMVHPEDTAEFQQKTDLSYIREFFKQNSQSLKISYRRKQGNEYRRVGMEILPAGELAGESSDFYLYIKYLH